MNEKLNSRSVKADFYDYDFENDSLLVIDRGAKYESSINFENIILDIDVDGLPIGVEILHASKLFDVSKSAIKNFQSFRADINISEKTIEINFTINVIKRNQYIEKIAISHGINDMNLPSAKIAMAC
jgi:uncharacterized protein YuzE